MSYGATPKCNHVTFCLVIFLTDFVLFFSSIFYPFRFVPSLVASCVSLRKLHHRKGVMKFLEEHHATPSEAITHAS